MIILNKQKSLISSQNNKIIELERQLNIFNNINISNEKNQKILFEKLENNLAATKDIENRIRVNITKEITQKVHQNYNKKINQNNAIDALKKEISELKTQNKIRDLKLNKYSDELNDKNIELNSMKDAMIKKQNDFIDKMKNQQNIRNKLKDVQFENQNLFKNINDLKSELELESERIRQQQRQQQDDDIKQQDDITKPLIISWCMLDINEMFSTKFHSNYIIIEQLFNRIINETKLIQNKFDIIGNSIWLVRCY